MGNRLLVVCGGADRLRARQPPAAATWSGMPSDSCMNSAARCRRDSTDLVARMDYHAGEGGVAAAALTIIMLLIRCCRFRRNPPRAQRRASLGAPRPTSTCSRPRWPIHVWTAMLAAKKGEAVRGFKKGLFPFLLIIGIVSLLILLEPNLSMAILVALVAGVVLFTAGAKIGHFLLLGVAGLFAGVSLIWAEPYRSPG